MGEVAADQGLEEEMEDRIVEETGNINFRLGHGRRQRRVGSWGGSATRSPRPVARGRGYAELHWCCAEYAERTVPNATRPRARKDATRGLEIKPCSLDSPTKMRGMHA